MLVVGLLPLVIYQGQQKQNSKKSSIDRKALAYRHNPSINKIDILSPFSVGNGDFAFTADVTGLQTFYNDYSRGIPLGTQSNWGWHSVPNINNYTYEQTLKNYNTYGRQVGYATDMNTDAAKYLRENPHRIDLGKIGFCFVDKDNSNIRQEDISNINQTLNLWEGILYSDFVLRNKSIHVETCSHPTLDQVAVKIHSDLLEDNKLGIAFDFSYGSLQWGKDPCDWNSPDKHESRIIKKSNNSCIIERVLDSTKYFVSISWKGNAEFEQRDKHKFILKLKDGKDFELIWNASQNLLGKTLPNSANTFTASKSNWKKYWTTGGAIDLSESKDPRAKELERRIVLSQYLTAINCSGSVPPQETGLTCNSWFGKSHLEMHWWHSAHFAFWKRPGLLEKSMKWYEQTLPYAEKQASRQGYSGARWPKMVGPDGKDCPSNVAVFLIWQQPHPIYYAELLYRAKKSRALLNQYKKIVFESADFMASYAKWDEKNNRYVLGPPLIPAQEVYDKEKTINPPFELSYWNFTLRIAQQWRERLGLQRDKKWDDVINHLSKFSECNGFYKNTETATNTFEDPFNRNDHPAVLGAYGMLPYENIDKEKMRATLKEVLKTWNWKTTWGWDYPLMAMTAARVGKPELAIEALLMDVQKNTYLNNGHNYQEDRLPIYLPGNGGLLSAVAMMAAGWSDSPKINAPGFPQDGKWVVKWEGINPLP